MYDLLQSPVVPVASAHLPRGDRGQSRPGTGVDAGAGGAASGAVYSVAFNPRQRDLVATGDSRGRVLIWRISWRLANKRPGEDGGLERLFKGSVSEVGKGDVRSVTLPFGVWVGERGRGLEGVLAPFVVHTLR